MGEILALASGKGGVGKTMLSAGLGRVLASMGKSVLIIDTDTGLRSLDLVFGMENQIVYHLLDVLNQKCPAEKALLYDRRLPSLHLMPTAQTREKNALKKEAFLPFLTSCRNQYDFVILDCPSGIEYGFQSISSLTDRGLVVLTPDSLSIRAADRIIGLWKTAGITSLDLLLNRTSDLYKKRGFHLSEGEITSLLGEEVLAEVPEDPQILGALKGGILSLPDTLPFFQALQQAASRLTGLPVPSVRKGRK